MSAPENQEKDNRLAAIWELFHPLRMAALIFSLVGTNVGVYGYKLAAGHELRAYLIWGGFIAALAGIAALGLTIALTAHHTEAQPLGCVILLVGAIVFIASLFLDERPIFAYLTFNSFDLLTAGALAYHSGWGWKGS